MPNLKQKKDPLFTQKFSSQLQFSQLLTLFINMKHKHTQKGSFLPLSSLSLFPFISQKEIRSFLRFIVLWFPLEFSHPIISPITASHTAFHEIKL